MGMVWPIHFGPDLANTDQIRLYLLQYPYVTLHKSLAPAEEVCGVGLKRKCDLEFLRNHI